MFTEREASPRTANAGPEASGETAATGPSARSSSTIFCHWSIERMRCSGFCTIAASATPWRSGRAVSCGGKSTMCGCEDGTRFTMVACCPASAADMKMITPTPIETPTMIETVCSRPSRRKRLAAIHSKGSQSRMRHRSQAGPRLDRRAGRHDAVPGGEPGADLDPAGAAQPKLHIAADSARAFHAQHPGRSAGRVAHRVRAKRERAGVARYLDVDRYGHILAQVLRRLGHAELDFHRAALRVHAGINVGHFAGEALFRVRVRRGERRLAEAQLPDVALVDLHHDLG